LSQLWAVEVATGQKRLLTPGDGVQPQWSPHGVRIAYEESQEGRRHICTVPASGGAPVRITNDTFLNWNPVWSPDGRHLYFVSDRGGIMNLWRVPVNEETGQTLGPPEPVTTPSPFTQHPSFSRDGRHLAYVHIAQSENIQRVAFDPDREVVIGRPSWLTQGFRIAYTSTVSPDGQWMAFAWVDPNQEDIYVMRTDGTGLRQLTNDTYRDRVARWSPDGNRIAFHSNRSGHTEIWIIHPDGSGLQQLTQVMDPPAACPVWSPDARRLAYLVEGQGTFIMDVDRPWNQQSPQAVPPIRPAQSWFGAWSWSPDGRRLAGWEERQENVLPGIVVYSLASQQFERITDFGADPVWLSDSRRLIFHNGSAFYVVDSQSKKVREIFSVAPHEPRECAVSRDDRFIYFSASTGEADIWLMTLE
jgi:Tol biopolymer transport system component